MAWVLSGALIAIALAVVAGFSGKGDEHKPGAGVTEDGKSRKGERSAASIADGVETVAQYRVLERKLDKAAEKATDPGAGGNSYERYQEALDMLANKTLAWQFIPEVSLTTPLDVAEAAYKVVQASEHDEWKSRLPDYTTCWHAMRGYDEPDEACDESKFIVKFRRIIENSDLTEEAQGKKINSLVSRNAEAAENFFDLSDGAEVSAVQWASINTLDT